MSEKEQVRDGASFLALVNRDEILRFSFDICLSHKEFVKRTVGELPEGAWVGTVNKTGGDLMAMNSYTFYGNEMPAPAWVQERVDEAFV